MTCHCLIIDDEAPARQLIAGYAAKIPELTVVAQCSNALAAQTVLKEHPVDLLFLDIEMPELTGLQFLKIAEKAPMAVLISAHASYALQSYELDVVDYLLKPVEFHRFYQAVSKAISRMGMQQKRRSENSGDSFLFVKADKEIIKIHTRDMLFAESQKEYVNIQLKDRNILIFQSLSKFMDTLPPHQFFRVHRSYIVNLNAIDKIIGNTIFIGSHRILISKGQRKPFMALINQNNLF